MLDGGQKAANPRGRQGEIRDSDFSAGISKSYSNTVDGKEFGGEGKVSFQASTKRGCTLSGNVEQSIKAAQDFVDDSKKAAVGKAAAKLIPFDDMFQKETWSGKYCSNKEECEKK